MFRKIVVGIDGSKASEDALLLGCNISQRYDSELHLVHTPQPQTVAFAMGAVAGYQKATTMPAPSEVQDAADKIINAGKQVKRSPRNWTRQSH